MIHIDDYDKTCSTFFLYSLSKSLEAHVALSL